MQILHINESLTAILPPTVYLRNWDMIFEELAESIEALTLSNSRSASPFDKQPQILVYNAILY